MTMTTKYPVLCDCGHRGLLRMRENDQPFSSQWERWSVSDLEGGTYYTEGYITLDEAFTRLEPTCPKCGTKLSPDHLQNKSAC